VSRNSKITTWDQVEKIRGQYPPGLSHGVACTCPLCALQLLLRYIEQIQLCPPEPLERSASRDTGKRVLYVPEREAGVIVSGSENTELVFVLYDGSMQAKATRWDDLIPWAGHVV